MCSQAVDYPKNGIPVNIDRTPHWWTPFKPDWHAAETNNPRRQDYYESTRALGHLYRAITLEDPTETAPGLVYTTPRRPLGDPISSLLKPRVERHLSSGCSVDSSSAAEDAGKLFKSYTDELEYICSTHTISVVSGTRLREEEVVVGTIMAQCSQRRWRKDRIYAMCTHASALVKDIQSKLLHSRKLEEATGSDLVEGLGRAWCAWDWSLRNNEKFGANSFGLISLAIIFDCLEKLDEGVR
jgi:RNA-dependent RNA polymerase